VDCCGSLTGAAATWWAKLGNHLDLDLCVPADGTYFQCETHSGGWEIDEGKAMKQSSTEPAELSQRIISVVRPHDQLNPCNPEIGPLLLPSLQLFSSQLFSFLPSFIIVGALRESTERDETLCRTRARTGSPLDWRTPTLQGLWRNPSVLVRETSPGIQFTEEGRSEEGLWEGKSINLCPILQLI